MGPQQLVAGFHPEGQGRHVRVLGGKLGESDANGRVRAHENAITHRYLGPRDEALPQLADHCQAGEGVVGERRWVLSLGESTQLLGEPLHLQGRCLPGELLKPVTAAALRGQARHQQRGHLFLDPPQYRHWLAHW